MLDRHSKIKITKWFLNGEDITRLVYSNRASIIDEAMELKKIASLVDGNHKDFATANPATEDNSELQAEIKELEAKRDELKAQLEALKQAKEEPTEQYDEEIAKGYDDEIAEKKAELRKRAIELGLDPDKIGYKLKETSQGTQILTTYGNTTVMHNNGYVSMLNEDETDLYYDKLKELSIVNAQLRDIEVLGQNIEEPQAENNMTLDEFITEVLDNTEFEKFRASDIADFEAKYSEFLDELTEMDEDERGQLSNREWRELMINLRDAEVIEEENEPSAEELEKEKLKEEYPYLKEGATASQNIKKELKRAYPNVKFSVRSDGNSVRIEWIDGVTEQQVENIANKYEMGKFDSMADMYEYKDEGRTFRKLFGGANYIFTNREYSEKALNWVLNKDNLRQQIKDLLGVNKVEVVDGHIMVDGDYLNRRTHEMPTSANPYNILSEIDLTQVDLDEKPKEDDESNTEEQNPMGGYVETVLSANSLEDFDREDIMEAIEKAEELYNSNKEKYQDEYNQIVEHMNKVALGG
jgi:uncharacterized FlaG/YvyC family protein